MLKDYGVMYDYADNELYKGVIQVIPSEAVVEGQTREEGEDVVFLHLDVRQWNKTTLKLLRKDLENVLKKSLENDVDCVSFVVPNTIGTKFHKMLRPLDYERSLDYSHTLGGWFTE